MSKRGNRRCVICSWWGYNFQEMDITNHGLTLSRQQKPRIPEHTVEEENGVCPKNSVRIMVGSKVILYLIRRELKTKELHD